MYHKIWMPKWAHHRCVSLETKQVRVYVSAETAVKIREQRGVGGGGGGDGVSTVGVLGSSTERGAETLKETLEGKRNCSSK